MVRSVEEVETWIRQREPVFLQALTEYGDLIGAGREYTRPFPFFRRIPGTFIGKNLCDIATTALTHAITSRYGIEVLAQPAHAQIRVSTRSVDHLWVRLGCGTLTHFADLVHRQINPKQSMIIFDQIEKEPDYFDIEEKPILDEACEYYWWTVERHKNIMSIRKPEVVPLLEDGFNKVIRSLVGDGSLPESKSFDFTS